MKCKNPQCGVEIKISNRYCPRCGYDQLKMDDSFSGPREKKEKLFDSGELASKIRNEVKNELAGIKNQTFPNGNQRQDQKFEIINSADIEKLSGFSDNDFLQGSDIENIKINVQVDCHETFNWSLINIGMPLINRVIIKNLDKRKSIENLIIRTKLALDYSDSWETTIGFIGPGDEAKLEKIKLPINKERLRTVKESELCNLKFEFYSKGNVIYFFSKDINIEPFNNWFFYAQRYPELTISVAGFILPNSKAVTEVIKNSGEYLKVLCGKTSFHGYQNNSQDTFHMAKAIYNAFQSSLKIEYINPPSSFDPPGQKILLPDGILELKRGTCLDLALFYAACIERSGLYPLIFFIPGHAFLGVWMNVAAYDAFWNKVGSGSNDNSQLLAYYIEAIKRKEILVLNSTTFTSDKDFQTCIKEGLSNISMDQLQYIVDVKHVRVLVKPMPVEE